MFDISWQDVSDAYTSELPMHSPVIHHDGGPFATHDQACAVCGLNKAVYNIGTGVMEPCWGCQQKGWITVQKKQRKWTRSHK